LYNDKVNSDKCIHLYPGIQNENCKTCPHIAEIHHQINKRTLMDTMNPWFHVDAYNQGGVGSVTGRKHSRPDFVFPDRNCH
jgi:hypothetical protein